MVEGYRRFPLSCSFSDGLRSLLPMPNLVEFFNAVVKNPKELD